MAYTVFAPCSRRKRAAIHPDLRAANLNPASLDELAEGWVARVRGTKPVVRATDLYGGRGLVEARRAASAASGQLSIVSAGLGIVDAEQAVVSYSLTVAAGDPDSVLARTKAPTRPSPADWWGALQRAFGLSGGGFTRALAETEGVALIALPGSYLDLVADDLLALAPDALSRVRLIGPPREAVPIGLRGVWMPYDARFDGEGGPFPGTRSDYAQRAARHFAETVLRTTMDADAATHAEMVEVELRPLSATLPPHRKAGTDAELIEVIRALVPQTGGRSGETLRLLRRKAGRACEQGRFRRLFAAATQGDLMQ
jgi:hypothetical protein